MEDNTMKETNKSSIIDNLKKSKNIYQDQLTYIQSRQEKKRRNAIIRILLGILFLCLLVINKFIINSFELETDNAIISFLHRDNPYIQYIDLLVGIILIYTGLVDLILTLNKNISILELGNYISQIDEELELIDITEKQYEKSAEIQFKNSQKALSRYYDINLEHLKMIFPVGIGTMAMGIVIIMLSILVFKNNVHQNIVPTLIGSLSGILIDFIGAIFIKMYIETVKTSAEFHSKLIHSNDNIFAYSLVMKIGEEKLRNEALAELAKIIAKNEE